ncbi:MAG TPA: C4-dicarboxylate ABC transporter, partial [Synergistaceae bacterium]|nr:C4-dicarboxylate ABC transporter [Synergistaceae bacterium]
EKLLSDGGTKIITFTDEELTKMKEKSQKTVWPPLEKDVGADILKEVAAEASK